MPRIIGFVVFIFCLTVNRSWLVAETETVSTPITDSIAASVNGEIITHREVAAFAERFNRDKKTILKELIDSRLILQAAQAKGIKVSDEEIEKELKKQIEKIGGQDEFENKVLKPAHMSLEWYREDIRQEILQDKYLLYLRTLPAGTEGSQTPKREFVLDVYVRPKEIREYFEQNKSLFTGGLRVKTRQIIIRFDQTTKYTKKTIAESILSQVTKGREPFEELARRFSDEHSESGGLWDYTLKGIFPPAVDEVVFSLKVGETSGLIQTEKDFRIIRIEDRLEPAEDVNSSDVQNRIRQILSRKKLMAGLIKLREILLKNAEIWIDPALATD